MLTHVVLNIPNDEYFARKDNTAKVSFVKVDEFDSTESSVTYSGVCEPYDVVDGETISLFKTEIKPADVILFQYSIDMDSEEVHEIKQYLCEQFPDNKVIGIVSDIDFMIEHPAEAIDMLKKMIAHIELVSSSKKNIIV